MKRILLFATLAFFIVSCSNEAGMSSAAKKNLDAMHGVNKCFETKDFSNLGDFVADSCVDYAGEQGPIRGLENMKAEFTKWSAMSENVSQETIKELADDEYAMAWMRFKGTMTVDNMGMKKGDSYDMQAVEVVQFNKDSKAIAHWTFVDPAEMMKMMSGMMPPPADTTQAPPMEKK